MRHDISVVTDFTGSYMYFRESNDSFDGQTKEAGIAFLDMSQIKGTDCYCDDAAMEAIHRRLEGLPPDALHFLDSGNYHYMTKLWLDKLAQTEAENAGCAAESLKQIQLVVFDHHPDAQAPAFGDILSCGGWILKVLEENPLVEKIWVVGVDESLLADIRTSLSSYLEERRLIFLTKQLLAAYFVTGSAAAFPEFQEFLELSGKRLYLSIDKDVLSKDEITTNWDNGSLATAQMIELLDGLRTHNEVAGVDICGEPDKKDATQRDVLMSRKWNEQILHYFNAENFR